MPTHPKQPVLDHRDKSSTDESWLKRLPTNLDNMPEAKTIPCKEVSWLRAVWEENKRRKQSGKLARQYALSFRKPAANSKGERYLSN